MQGLVIHATVDQIGQFGPLGGRKLVPILVEKIFLRNKKTFYFNCMVIETNGCSVE